jgi:hypothetical protein
VRHACHGSSDEVSLIVFGNRCSEAYAFNGWSRLVNMHQY